MRLIEMASFAARGETCCLVNFISLSLWYEETNIITHCSDKTPQTDLQNKEENYWEIKGRSLSSLIVEGRKSETKGQKQTPQETKNNDWIFMEFSGRKGNKEPFQTWHLFTSVALVSFFFIIFGGVIPQCVAYRLACLLVVLKAVNWLFGANK